MNGHPFGVGAAVLNYNRQPYHLLLQLARGE